MANVKTHSKSSDAGFGIGKAYLVLYNVVQVLGWSHILWKTSDYYIRQKEGRVYDEIDLSLTIFQTAAFLEIVNVVVGLVRSGLATTIFQVASRLFVVWVAFHGIPASQNSLGVPFLLFAWSITEIIRYGYYALSLLKIDLFIVTWLRYTTFYILYPLGVTGEVLVLFSCIPIARAFKPFTYEMPNPLNFTFSFEYFLYLVLALYVPGLPLLYTHMIMLRKKVLGRYRKTTETTNLTAHPSNNERVDELSKVSANDQVDLGGTKTGYDSVVFEDVTHQTKL